jgi:SHS family sialic acid transporter-like MFS transporter
MSDSPLSPIARCSILIAAGLGLVFDGIELGLMPIASLSVSKSLMGDSYTSELGGQWFAWFTAALMLGAAIGGIVLGNLGDRIGRSRAMGVSILFYSVFAVMGAWVTRQEEMLVLRFLVGLGVGGLWPNAMALVAESWSTVRRPLAMGVMSAGLNGGILLLSQIARVWPISPDSWRWLFHLAGVPAILGIFALTLLPESPTWLANRHQGPLRRSASLGALFHRDLLPITIVAICLASIPLIGAWSASKWMIPWADKIASAQDPGYKGATQGWWALGATIGSFIGAQLVGYLGRRTCYLLISIGTTLLTIAMFQWTAPLQPGFHAVVFAQGLVATLFFGWLAVFLPEIFPVHVRASGSGLAYNSGRFATAVGVIFAGGLFALLGGDYKQVGTVCAFIYALGIIAIWLIPEKENSLDG